MKYFYIILFLITHDLTELKNCWEVEFIGREFKWRRLFRRVKNKTNRYIFWYRLSYFMSRSNNASIANAGRKLATLNNLKYNIDISILANIGIGLNIWHTVGIVITSRAKIGKNFNIASGVVIGFKDYKKNGSIEIGHNVTIGTNSVIFGDNLKIGNNVHIGAMSFINKNIYDNHTVYTKKENVLTLLKED